VFEIDLASGKEINILNVNEFSVVLKAVAESHLLLPTVLPFPNITKIINI